MRLDYYIQKIIKQVVIMNNLDYQKNIMMKIGI